MENKEIHEIEKIWAIEIRFKHKKAKIPQSRLFLICYFLHVVRFRVSNVYNTMQILIN